MLVMHSVTLLCNDEGQHHLQVFGDSTNCLDSQILTSDLHQNLILQKKKDLGGLGVPIL